MLVRGDIETPWYTRKDVALRLNVPVSKLASWATNKTGPAYSKPGGNGHPRYHDRFLTLWEQGNREFVGHIGPEAYRKVGLL